MSTYQSYWALDANGDWTNSTDWWTYVPNASPPPGYQFWQNVVPGLSNDVSLTPTTEPSGVSAGTSPFTISYSATDTINSLSGPSFATLNVTGGSLTVTSTIALNGPLNISGGLVDIQNTGGATSSEGGLGAANAYLPGLDLTGGALQIDAGALVLTGTNTIAGGVVKGAGDFVVGGYSTLAINAGASVTAATFELGVALNGNTSSTTLNADFSYTGHFLLDDYSGNNAVLNLNGHTLTLSGTAGFSGTINGPGELLLTSGETATFSPPNYSGFYAQGGVKVVNQGTVTEDDNFQLDGTFDNQAGAIYDFTTDGGLYNEGTVSVTNEGRWEKTAGTGTSTIYGAFTTTGIVDAQTGAIGVSGSGGTLSGTIKGAGGFSIFGGGVYTLSALTLTAGSFGIDGSGGGGAKVVLTASFAYGGTFLAGSQFANTTLDLAGKTLTLSGAATFTAPYGSVNLTGGGLLKLALGSTSAIDGTNVVAGVTVENAGTLTDNGYFVLDSDSGAAASVLKNDATGVIDIGNVQNALTQGGTSGKLVNLGTIAKIAGTGDSDIKVALTNTGTLEADTGSIWLYKGGSLGGTLSGAGTIALRGGSAYTLSSTLNLTVGYLDVLDTAVVTVGKAFTYGGVFYEGGTFSNTQLKLGRNTFTFTNSATFTAPYGAVTLMGGRVVIASGATAAIDNTNIAGGATFENAGTLADNLYVVLDSDSGTAASVLQNDATGVIDLAADGTAFSANGTSGKLTNAGTIDKTVGTGDSDIKVALTNTGTLKADTGSIWLYNGGLLSGTLSGAGGIALRSSAAYTLSSTLNLTVSHLDVRDSAVVTTGKGFTYGGVFYEGGQFSGTHLKLGGHTFTFTNSATFTAPFGAVNLDGAGRVMIAMGATAAIDNTNIAAGVTFENAGTLTDNLYVTLDSDGGAAASLLKNDRTGVMNITGDGPAVSSKGASAQIINAGKIDKTAGTGVSTIAPAIVNTGKLEADSGTLDLQGAVSGTGKDVISASSGLEFDSSVASGQTVSFSGSNGTLRLNDFGAFGGVISGFDKTGTGDVIDVAGPWTWVGFKENAAHTSGLMTFANNGTQFSVTLLGNYTDAGFTPTPSGGGTQVTYA